MYSILEDILEHTAQVEHHKEGAWGYTGSNIL